MSPTNIFAPASTPADSIFGLSIFVLLNVAPIVVVVFALLAYVSAWLKCHYPAAFAAALINSQPMGFYGPAQLIYDAQAHGVAVHGCRALGQA